MKYKKLIVLPFIALLLSSCFLDDFTSDDSKGSEQNGVSGVTSESSSNRENSEKTSSSKDETAKEGMRLKWSDEFDGYSLNSKNWTPQVGDGSPNTGWGNQEKQWYTDREENVYVEDGNLVITARKEKLDERRSYEYTSARIRSAGKVSTLYGYIKARIKLPPIEGLWPAFWMLPEYPSPYGGWPNSGEIDIMEVRGRISDRMTSALHYGGNAANNGGYSTYKHSTYIFKDSTIADYHTYAIKWEPELIEWFVDDVSYFTMEPASVARGGWWSASSDNDLAPFDTEFHILLNMAVGGHFDEHRLPPNDFVAANMYVDYVRIYDLI